MVLGLPCHYHLFGRLHRIIWGVAEEPQVTDVWEGRGFGIHETPQKPSLAKCVQPTSLADQVRVTRERELYG